MNWTYDAIADTWLYGTEKEGCGVFNDGNGWEGNVVLGTNYLILGVGPLPTKEQAMEECIKQLNELKEDLC